VGYHGDGLVPAVGLELTPDLSRPRRRGQTWGRSEHDRTSTSPKVLRGSLGAVYDGRHVRVRGYAPEDRAPAGGGAR